MNYNMLTPEQKEQIISGLIWENWPEVQKGGQHCGMPIRGYKLTHPDFAFEVKCADSRQSYKNREICMTMFELFLMEITK